MKTIERVVYLQNNEITVNFLSPLPPSFTDSLAAAAGMMAAAPLCLFVLFTAALLTEASSDSGTVIPAESRPCVDCHAFEFMQRALQDLKRTANNLNTRTDDLLLRVEKRALCDCLPFNLLA